ncbi:site-2 protease family protein [Pimelobacter simplex]|uniref:site-2 protease family protein n=1 Tax=Nocardioides simplex TaxID=2045 RepID=UPI0021503FA1|nr:site-2 protease family protein [Pimelobacter simplex]UUW88046.1 site-2 protease family protein [Pimelobacter simplex]UUW97550.1 site-2 protease family protein [Pimelobacter simplex]
MSGSSPSRPERAPVPRGMFRIGQIAGSDVLVSGSWFLIAGLIALIMAPRVDQVQSGLGVWKYVVGLAFAIALYLAVLLHEASHAVVARRFGFRVHSITLHFLGGATAIEGEAQRPRQEFWIAVVGPLTSILVGAGALGLWFVIPEGLLRLVVEGLAGANLLIGVLNLVPGLPLDGGRVLKAGVWAVTGRVETGTTVAAWGGRVLALLVGAWALWSTQFGSITSPLILGIVAIFLWTGASQALAVSQISRQFSRLDPVRLARRGLAVAPDLPLAEAVRRAREAEAGGIVTVTSDGRPSGLVNEDAARAVPEERRPWVPVSSVAHAIGPERTLPADVSGAALLETLRHNPATEYLLLNPDGSVYGVLVTSDVLRLVRRSG